MSTAEKDQTPRADSSPRILIVSGDPVLRERLYDLFTRRGYSTKTVVNGKIGIETMIHESPHLIIANSSADDCAGWGFPDRIRRFNPEVPIILLGHPDEDPPDPRTVNDIQAYFHSDVSDSTLLDAVKRWLFHAQSANPVEPISYPGTILVIDDEPEFLQALEEFLRPRRCEVVTARSGEEGLEKMKQAAPALVMLDLKMPGMDGLVALRKIKELQPNLPVVMMTAEEDERLMAQAFALGALEYVVKPYNLKTLRLILFHAKKATEGS